MLDLTTFLPLSWMLKRQRGDADDRALIVKTTADGGVVVTDAPGGIVQVRVAALDSFGLRPGVFAHELKCTRVGTRIALLDGLAVLTRSIHANV